MVCGLLVYLPTEFYPGAASECPHIACVCPLYTATPTQNLSPFPQAPASLQQPRNTQAEGLSVPPPVRFLPRITFILILFLSIIGTLVQP